jgi:hypothetical protein
MPEGAMRNSHVRRGLLFAVLCTALVGATPAAMPAPQQALTVDPTPLEALATQDGSRTTWSKWIGRLDGGSAYAVVTAVAIESSAGVPRTMRGVRIDLRHEGARPGCDLKHVEWAVMCDRELAAAYIEEDRLAEFRSAVLSGRAVVHPGHSLGVTTFRSSAPSWGILLCGYSLHGRSVEELAALLDEAMAALASTAG